MRVISGDWKGLRLKAVPGSSTRPTTDKVKESIFNMIGPYFEGGIGLDLFAGSGGLGLEALSRGFEKMIFVDRDTYAFQTIKDNVKTCKAEDLVELYKIDAERALKAIVKREVTFDGIFLDPPYKKQQLISLLEKIDHHTLVNESGFVMCEHHSDVELPQQVGNLVCIRKETYGIISISIYRNRDEEEAQ
ncbi:16S rRNA (guanine(966)-N(2))-methyltransferase RsmD [Mangrovibacillus cuniculi]|uniref:16S rRNA (Guanine(966)-N(2))-methyltransferase RsmD n=1 Tax=Mangrovibacillus cuniculi TaxID=2593652 RepID=A0A7S8CA81_9BACI|nr:16S rRNA (guanine(966)-N(2))-methyltransferase RsmD [Mangrovibacillus cuniculi]QPC46233.1 16S rRNA (guanine(966)-N(2))-methyltransferase RsmD [Mangrovibacillus cuniculi]